VQPRYWLEEIGPHGVSETLESPCGAPTVLATVTENLGVGFPVHATSHDNFRPRGLADLQHLRITDGEPGSEFPCETFAQLRVIGESSGRVVGVGTQ